MQNLDKKFYELDNDILKTGLIAYRGDSVSGYDTPGLGDDHIYIGEDKRGTVVMDIRLSYQITPLHKIALISNNFLNKEYSLRPLKIEAPRTFSIQYTLKV